MNNKPSTKISTSRLHCSKDFFKLKRENDDAKNEEMNYNLNTQDITNNPTTFNENNNRRNSVLSSSSLLKNNKNNFLRPLSTNVGVDSFFVETNLIYNFNLLMMKKMMKSDSDNFNFTQQEVFSVIQNFKELGSRMLSETNKNKQEFEKTFSTIEESFKRFLNLSNTNNNDDDENSVSSFSASSFVDITLLPILAEEILFSCTTTNIEQDNAFFSSPPSEEKKNNNNLDATNTSSDDVVPTCNCRDPQDAHKKGRHKNSCPIASSYHHHQNRKNNNNRKDDDEDDDENIPFLSKNNSSTNNSNNVLIQQQESKKKLHQNNKNKNSFSCSSCMKLC